ncbi:MAG: S66 peptidase family protein [Eubacteriales bacterium]
MGVISPCYVCREEDISGALAALSQMGFNARTGQHIYKDTYGYAASPEERAEDFNNMALDKSINMVLFGGGEVGNEILPLIDYDTVRANPKIYCSYSDGTTILNALYSKSELITFHGATLRTFDGITNYNLFSFENRLITPSPVFTLSGEWNVLRRGICEGILIGGYLVNFAVMLSGKYFTFNKDRSYILFLEDHEMFSSPAVVSKYLSHIEQSPFINNIRGLIFGHYSTNPQPILLDILKRFSDKHKIPAMKCDDFGHGVNNAILPIGVSAKLDANNSSLIFLEDSVL